MNFIAKNRARPDGAQNVLGAYYDLSNSPLSYDFSAFVVEAERIRRRRRLDGVRFYFVPVDPGMDGFDDMRLDRGKGNWMLHNLVLPIANFLPSSRGTLVFASRAEAAKALTAEVENGGTVFPDAYTVEQPNGRHHTGWSIIAASGGDQVQYLRAGGQARAFARQWIDAHAGGRKCVVMTLREAEHGVERNSDLQVWSEFARRLDAAGFFPVVIRDTGRALDGPPEGFEGIACFAEAAFNLELRFALYEEAHIAAFVSNGPAQLCFYNPNVNYIYMPSGDWQSGAKWRRTGFEHGRAPAFAGENQLWLWNRQDANILFRAALDLDAKLESGVCNPASSAGNAARTRGICEQIEAFERIYDWNSARHFDKPDDIELLEYCFDLLAPELQDDPRHRLRHASMLFHARRIEQAMDLFEPLINGDTGMEISLRDRDHEIFIPLGCAAERFSQYDLAIECYERLIGYGIDSAMALFRLATVYKLTGRFDDAAGCFNMLMEMGVQHPKVFEEFGDLYERMGNRDAAIGIYQRAEEAGVLDQNLIRRKSALQCSA